MAIRLSRFVLVPIGCGGVITDMDKTPIDKMAAGKFDRQYNVLQNHMEGKGGCEAIIWYDNGQGNDAFAWSRNTPMGKHADENLFLEQCATTLTIKAALITIEPCRDHRYGTNHNYYEFFKGGRKVAEIGRTCKFIAAGPDTPVFYCEKQPAPGVTSGFSRSLVRLDPEHRRAYLAHLGGGVQWGVPTQGQRTKLWIVGGQRAMTTEEIVQVLKEFYVAPHQWDPESCAEEVQAEVRELLSTWAHDF